MLLERGRGRRRRASVSEHVAYVLVGGGASTAVRTSTSLLRYCPARGWSIVVFSWLFLLSFFSFLFL